MNEQQLIEALWKFASWSAGAIVGLVAVIFAIFRGALTKITSRVDQCATKEEVAKIERDLKDELRDHRNERMRRDDKVDETLGEIKAAVTQTHRRIDDFLSAMVGKGGGR